MKRNAATPAKQKKKIRRRRKQSLHLISKKKKRLNGTEGRGGHKNYVWNTCSLFYIEQNQLHMTQDPHTSYYTAAIHQACLIIIVLCNTKTLTLLPCFCFRCHKKGISCRSMDAERKDARHSFETKIITIITAIGTKKKKNRSQ